MKKCISTNTIRLAGPEKEFEIGSPSTTRKDPTNPWATKPLGRFSWKEKNQHLSRTEPTIDSCSDPFLFSETYVLRKGLKTVLTNRSTSILRVEETIKQPYQWTGRPAQEWSVLCRAFIAKLVLGLPTRSLIDRLKSDESLARICGWSHASKVPHESTFSRVFAQLARLNVAERILLRKLFWG